MKIVNGLIFLMIILILNCFESKSEKILGYGSVKNAIFSPDGTKIATCGPGGIFIWNATSGDTVLAIRRNTGSVNVIDFNPVESSFASCSGTSIQFWDLNTGINYSTFETGSGILNIKYSRDGKRLAYGCSNGTICVLDVQENKIVNSFSCSLYNIFSISFSPNLNKLVTTSEGPKFQNVLALWDVNTGKSIIQKTFPWQGIIAVFSYDEEIMAYFMGKTIYICNSKNGDINSIINSPHDIHSLDFSHNGKNIACTYHDVINIKDYIENWNIETGDTLWSLLINSDYSSTYKINVHFSPDDKNIVCGFSGNPVIVLDASSGNKINTLSGHTCGIQGISFSPDGKFIVSGGEDGTVKVWDINSEKLINTIGSIYWWISGVEFSKDGSTILVSSGMALNSFDFKTGTKLWEIKGHDDVIWDIEYSPDSKIFTSCSSDGLIKIWDSDSGKLNKTYNTNNGVIHSINYHPIENKLLSSGWGRFIKILDLNSDKELLSFVGSSEWIDFVKYSPDGKYIVSVARDNALKLWNANTSELIKSLEYNNEAFGCPDFSPSGEYLACGTSGGKVVLWDMKNFSVKKILSANNLGASRVRFSIDGTKLASSGPEGTIFIWDIDEIVSVQEELTQISFDFIISPNPAAEFIEISYPSESSILSEGSHIKIYNVFGQEVLDNSQLSIVNSQLDSTPLNSPASEGHLKIDVSSLPPGVYFVRVGGKVKKFIKI